MSLNIDKNTSVQYHIKTVDARMVYSIADTLHDARNCQLIAEVAFPLMDWQIIKITVTREVMGND